MSAPKDINFREFALDLLRGAGSAAVRQLVADAEAHRIKAEMELRKSDAAFRAAFELFKSQRTGK